MKRLLKLALTLAMATLAIFASLNITAQPAHAIYCARTFLGCSFSGHSYFDIYVCCMYKCPDGSTRMGVCGHA